MKTKDKTSELRQQKGVDWLLIRNAHNKPRLKAIAAAVRKAGMKKQCQ